MYLFVFGLSKKVEKRGRKEILGRKRRRRKKVIYNFLLFNLLGGSIPRW
jgi:hypothetical protein